MSRDLRARVERETGPLPRCLLYVGGVLVREEYAHRIGTPERLEQIAARINAALDRGVTELIKANNREVERRRAAEAERDRLRAMVDHLHASGALPAIIVELLPQRPHWTAAELRDSVRARGVAASAKQIYNCLGHLSRTGRAQRLGYGCYAMPTHAARAAIAGADPDAAR